MLIYAIDDEENVLRENVETISEAVENVSVKTFNRGNAAIDAVMQGQKPDIVFSDIEMPGISGLEFAVKLKEISPKSRIVFVTGYEKYAVEAFRIKAHGYLLKPLTVEAIKEELAYIPAKRKMVTDKLVINCFGHFDVYWQGKPLIFGRKQSKELLAYLIDRKGASLTGNEIALALWENEGDIKAEQNRIRVLINDLRNKLKEIGMEQVIIRKHRELAIRTELVDCDYYRMLEGDMDALNSYYGKYMEQYSWAEITNAELTFKSKQSN